LEKNRIFNRNLLITNLQLLNRRLGFVRFLTFRFQEVHCEQTYPGPALEIYIVGEFPLKSEIWRPKLKYLVRIRRLFLSWRLREFHALYPLFAGPGRTKRLFRIVMLMLWWSFVSKIGWRNSGFSHVSTRRLLRSGDKSVIVF
jgi:hypothetical protein